MNPSPEMPKTLRDEFAMAALNGLLSSDLFVKKINEQVCGDDHRRRTLIVYQSYVFADSMLAERKK